MTLRMFCCPSQNQDVGSKLPDQPRRQEGTTSGRGTSGPLSEEHLSQSRAAARERTDWRAAHHTQHCLPAHTSPRRVRARTKACTAPTGPGHRQPGTRAEPGLSLEPCPRGWVGRGRPELEVRGSWRGAAAWVHSAPRPPRPQLQDKGPLPPPLSRQAWNPREKTGLENHRPAGTRAQAPSEAGSSLSSWHTRVPGSRHPPLTFLPVCANANDSESFPWDSHDSPVVKNPPSNAGDAGSIPSQATKIPQAAGGATKPTRHNY